MKNTRVKFRRDILEAGFSTARAARLTRLSPRQLDYWDPRAFLTPSPARADGYGTARRYSSLRESVSRQRRQLTHHR